MIALTEDRLLASGNTNRLSTMAKVLWLIRQHIDGKQVDRVKATASVFNWARRQREMHSVSTISQTLAS